MVFPTVSDFNEQVNSQTLLVSVGLFLCSAASPLLVSRIEFLVELLRLEYLALGIFFLSAVLAARDDGLWRAWLFTFSLAAGFGIHLVGIGITGALPGPIFRVAWAGFVGVGTALVLGTLGGSLGLGLKHLSTE